MAAKPCTMPRTVLLRVALALATVAVLSGQGVAQQVAEVWRGETHRDLHNEYGHIFRHGNRNAASHRWSAFLLNRSEQMTASKLNFMFSGFCAVSGSPVTPSDYTRYFMTLDRADGGGTESGYTYYCCWPCVCDTQDFIRVDTKTIRTAQGEQQFKFLVIGNPCDHPEELTRPFVQPFGQRLTTLAQEAKEVRCEEGKLEGAMVSDNGYIIISMFFPADAPPDGDSATGVVPSAGTPPPLKSQHQKDFQATCKVRADNGYNSGMGEIFRKVAAISPIGAGAAIGAGTAEAAPPAAAKPLAAAAGEIDVTCVNQFDIQYGEGYCDQRSMGTACDGQGFRLNCAKACGVCSEIVREKPPPDEELPAGWVARTSTSSGKVYYYNVATDDTTFDRPIDKPQLDVVTDDAADEVD